MSDLVKRKRDEIAGSIMLYLPVLAEASLTGKDIPDDADLSIVMPALLDCAGVYAQIRKLDPAEFVRTAGMAYIQGAELVKLGSGLLGVPQVAADGLQSCWCPCGCRNSNIAGTIAETGLCQKCASGDHAVAGRDNPSAQGYPQDPVFLLELFRSIVKCYESNTVSQEAL